MLKHNLLLLYQIGKMRGLHVLTEMFLNATSNDERVSSANALRMLLFDADNREIFKGIKNALATFSQHKVCSLTIVFQQLPYNMAKSTLRRKQNKLLQTYEIYLEIYLEIFGTGMSFSQGDMFCFHR